MQIAQTRRDVFVRLLIHIHDYLWNVRQTEQFVHV